MADHHVSSEAVLAALGYPRGFMIPEPESMSGAVQALVFAAVPFLYRGAQTQAA